MSMNMDRLKNIRWYEGLSETPPFTVVDRRPRWLRRLMSLFWGGMR